MYYWIVILSLIFILLPVMYFKKNTNWCIGMLYIAGVFAFAPMFFSIYRFEGIPVSLVFPAQLFTGGVEYKNFMEIINSYVAWDAASRPAIMLCCTFIYVLAPVFTISFIFNYVRRRFDGLFIRTLIKKDVYIFSEFNNNTLKFAESLKKNNKKAVIIFARSKKQIEYKGYLFAEFSVERIFEIINKTNMVHIVFADIDEEKSLNRFFRFKEKVGNRRVEVFVYSTKRDAEYIIDEVKQTDENIKLQLINTEQLLVLDTLWNYPLYTNLDSNKFNISVFGVGNMGSSFVKDVLWCTSLAGFDATINLIDKGNAISNLVEKCPYLEVDKFNINVYCNDVLGQKFSEIIRDTDIEKSNYIFVSLGDDSLNVDIASRLRLYFQRLGKEPTIVTVIENDDKREILEGVFLSEKIMLTGNISQFCDFEYIIKNNMFKFGVEIFKIVGAHYNKGKVPPFEDFCKQNQTEIYSSLSNAVHIKYKIFSLFGNEFEYGRDSINKLLSLKSEGATKEECADVLAEIIKEKNKLSAKLNENIYTLSESEHNRWNVFEKLKGYLGIPFDELEAFISDNGEKIKNGIECKLHKNVELRYNACITDYSNLGEIDMLREKHKSKSETKENDEPLESVKVIDELITSKIPEIWYAEVEPYIKEFEKNV